MGYVGVIILDREWAVRWERERARASMLSASLKNGTTLIVKTFGDAVAEYQRMSSDSNFNSLSDSFITLCDSAPPKAARRAKRAQHTGAWLTATPSPWMVLFCQQRPSGTTFDWDMVWPHFTFPTGVMGAQIDLQLSMPCHVGRAVWSTNTKMTS